MSTNVPPSHGRAQPVGSVGTHPQFTETAPAPRIELTVEREAGAPGSRTVVFEGEFLRVGAHPSNDLVLADPLVSRFHCRLTREKSAWRLLDTGSLNGTFVSGVPVRDGDLPLPECRIQAGDSVVRVRELDHGGKVLLLERPNFGSLYGTSAAMRKLFALLERVSQSEANVLIEGESGTGKELVATEIVKRGPRADKAFVIVDCGAISPNLVESALFGHVRGAFTGADRDRTGAFEAADGGTVFLDEIGELPLEMQPKLLRALGAREIHRVGDHRARPVDVRVVAATNRKLERQVNHGLFREDLFFRLSVVTIRLPPLRERLEDLELLVPVLLEQLGAQASAHLFTPAVLGQMAGHDWPGNVRELRNYVERAVVLQSVEDASDDDDAGEPQGPESVVAAAGVDLEVPLKVAKERLVSSFERAYLAALLDWAQGNVSRAARKANMDRMNLHRLIQRYGLRAPRSFRD